MKDAMLSELYQKAFQYKRQAEELSKRGNDEVSDRMRQVAIAKNELLSDLIDIRTEQIRRG